MCKRLIAAKTLLQHVEQWYDLPNKYQGDELKKKEERKEKEIKKWVERVLHYENWGAW